MAISSLIILISGSSAIAKKNNNASTVWDVYPTMSRAEIQAVIDGASDGDTVLFHSGTYDWSDTPLAERAENIGAISIIDKTLTIKGAQSALLFGRESEDPLTTYARGVNAFHVEDLDADNDVTFDGLSFQTFLRGISCCYSANFPEYPDILAPNVRNITVKDCTFSDIHRDAISVNNVRGDILIEDNDISADRLGMYINWAYSENEEWQPDDTYVKVLGNKILGNKINSDSGGVYFAKTTNVLVKQNTIEFQYRGIDSRFTRKGLVISDNAVFNSRYGIYIHGHWSNGIKLEAEEALIERNKLIDITYLGIVLGGDACSGHTVSKNEIHMLPGSRSGIITRSHDDYFGQNKISGSGQFAFYLYTLSGCSANHETLHANNVNQFSPDICHFYLDYGTHDNLIVGSGMGHNTYFDAGYDNRIIGVAPMTGGIGQDLSEAVKERNEELKEAKDIKF